MRRVTNFVERVSARTAHVTDRVLNPREGGFRDRFGLSSQHRRSELAALSGEPRTSAGGLARRNATVGGGTEAQPAPPTFESMRDQLLEAPEHREIFARNPALRALVSTEGSQPLVALLLEDQAHWREFGLDLKARFDRESAVEELDAHYPNLIEMLSRSPDIQEDLCKHLAVLKSVLRGRDPNTSEEGEQAFRRKITLLNLTEELSQRLDEAPGPDQESLENNYRRLQTEWTTGVFENPSIYSDNPGIPSVISLLDFGDATTFASGCPRKDTAGLKNFLTLAAKKNLTVLALTTDADFDRYPHMEKYFEEGEHEFDGIKWTARDITSDEQRERWESMGDFGASCHELTITLAEGEPPRIATVIRCERWPDAGSVPLTHAEQLLDEVDRTAQPRSVSDNAEASLPNTLVHCAWGIERTSVFAAIGALRDAARNNQTISVEEIVTKLRIARGGDGLTPLGRLNQLRMVVQYALKVGQPVFKNDHSSVLDETSPQPAQGLVI